MTEFSFLVPLSVQAHFTDRSTVIMPTQKNVRREKEEDSTLKKNTRKKQSFIGEVIPLTQTGSQGQTNTLS